MVSIENNNKEIIAIESHNETQYAKKNYYVFVKEKYNEILTRLENDLERMKSKPGPSIENEQNEFNQQYEENRRMYKNMLTSNLAKYEHFDSNENSIEDLEFIMQRIDKYYDLFAKYHFLLLQTPHLEEREQLESEHESMTDEFHTFSVRIESAISDKKRNAPNPPPTTFDSDIPFNVAQLLEQCLTSKNEIRLPPIEVPKFNGTMEKWPEFRELFVNMIHDNQKLHDVQKMQYLKTHIEGPAADVIKHLQINSCNYASAWLLLNKRYNNKKLLINNNIERLLQQRYVKDEKSNDIKCLLDTTKEVLHSL